MLKKRTMKSYLNLALALGVTIALSIRAKYPRRNVSGSFKPTEGALSALFIHRKNVFWDKTCTSPFGESHDLARCVGKPRKESPVFWRSSLRAGIAATWSSSFLVLRRPFRDGPESFVLCEGRYRKHDRWLTRQQDYDYFPQYR
jgi:hypothetical protein